jgi:N-acetylglucosamine-6-phosphate deacetylase
MEGEKSQGQDSNGQRGQLAKIKLILYNKTMKYSLFPIFVLSFLIFTSCNSDTYPDSDSMIIEGILYSTEEPVSIKISDGKIIGIKPGQKPSDGPQLFIAPGLVDIQINGYNGVDFSDPGLTPEDLKNIVEGLWEVGVTTILATVTTASHEQLLGAFKALSNGLTDPDVSMTIPGFHLEGPYISPVQGFRGAHPEIHIRPPDLQEFKQYKEAANNMIRLITVAPEFDGVMPIIQYCADNGIVVSLGHHNGTAEEIAAAVDAGASLSTHLGNGCANTIHRHNNPLWPQLAEDRLSASIITDGFHLNKDEVRTFYKVKGDELTILVSDAVDLAGLPLGEYNRWGGVVELTADVVKFPAENVLAGAAAPISKCVGNMMQFTGCSLESAINMATRNPARLIGLEDVGEIKEGKRADLILFSMEDKEMAIKQTILNGDVVYQAE